MPFVEFALHGAPVSRVGIVLYLLVQRWLCHPGIERGIHWRGLALKVACWPVYMAGTVPAILRAGIPYIPTSKEAVRGRFVRLARPHLVHVAIYTATLARTVYWRAARTPEGSLELTSEAVWGMIAFATLSLVLASGVLRTAWESRRPPVGNPWDGVDIEEIGGPAG